jgi:hypothetical protein
MPPMLYKAIPVGVILRNTTFENIRNNEEEIRYSIGLIHLKYGPQVRFQSQVLPLIILL